MVYNLRVKIGRCNLKGFKFKMNNYIDLKFKLFVNLKK